jgi:putative DNA methylase
VIDHPRLIEVAFPLKQASLDSVHEKNVRHGHISTLHIWPARRPLAACRAALIATLLPDPGTPEKREELLEKIGGKVVTEVQKKKVGGKTVETIRERTEGGVLRWGNENSPDMDWFREEIKKAYGGRAPRVLDPFAGGGAIPLEAMRLGCDVTAVDINPVAWFILKGTLEYPQKLAGQTRPLPKFALESGAFMETFLKGTGKLSKKQVEKELAQYQRGLFPPPEADLAWHVRAWGWWVLQRARKDLERFYPTVDGKPAVAYLWARTITCKNCRATIPLLKTRWLCKKHDKRIVLTMEPNADKTGVVYGVQNNVPNVGGNGAQKREHDKRVATGTMSRSGVTCPCCGMIMTMEDIRQIGQGCGLGLTPTASIVESSTGKAYRLPSDAEIQAVKDAKESVEEIFKKIPFGLPNEQTPGPAGSRLNSSSLRFYGLNKWSDLFTPRQSITLGYFVMAVRSAHAALTEAGYSDHWISAILTYSYCSISRLADRDSQLCTWQMGAEKIGHTFARFAFPITWDFVEVMPWADSSGGFGQAVEWVAKTIEHLTKGLGSSLEPRLINQSATQAIPESLDVVLTDPPYYDAISYSDLMDFFYIWMRRTVSGLTPELTEAVREPLTPKWDASSNLGELMDNPSRYGVDKAASKAIYELGMSEVFSRCFQALVPDGRLVVVFAHKNPDAWETLVAAIIRSGFVVDGSWPIQTEREMRMRAQSSAALSSSVWLVCRKRSGAARPGWDNRVLDEMRQNIHTRLRDYWDAGIRGPDFVWAATGPAMGAYSKHPVVKKANEPGKLMGVSEFLRAVRRLVVDFVVGRVLTGEGGDETTATGLDDVTTYYILHRHDFGLGDAPVGACILYAVSCNLSDTDLTNRHEILLRTGGLAAAAAEDDGDADDDESDEPDADAEPEEGTGSTVKLRTWNQRKRKTMGYDEEGRPAPLIDQVHRLMLLWKLGDVVKVDDYLDARGLRKNAIFLQLLQALIELAGEGTDERVVLENLSNHLAARGVAPARSQTLPGLGGEPEDE